jgi:hypothetical protein
MINQQDALQKASPLKGKAPQNAFTTDLQI